VLKWEEYSQVNTVWENTADDEPVFIICGRDELAAVPIVAWIEAARAAGVAHEKIKDAEELLQSFRDYEHKKLPD